MYNFFIFQENKSKDVKKMKISWVKYKQDEDSFRIPKNLGLDVVEIEDLEKTDETLKQLLDEHYNTIIVSNQVAGFSQDIIKEYHFNDSVNIIISPSKRKNG